MGAADGPNPIRILDALNSFQRSYALRTAIELDLFARIGDGARVPQIAARTASSARGIRVLCDYLAICGFLVKDDDTYTLSADAAAFLDSRAPTYIGSGVFFLTHPTNVAQFANLTEAVRKGGTAHGRGNLEPDAAIWVEFARWMAPLAAMLARGVAEAVNRPGQPMKVLDVAAGHGEYGIAVARLNPDAEVYAQDWPGVLELARQRAEAAGVASRYQALPGDAFTVELGEDYDLILVPNFLHHFSHSENVHLLKRLRGAIARDGRVATLEFVPNNDRLAPATAAAFSLTMLASTESGDAYTLRELEAMFRDAGFGATRARSLGPQTLLLTDARAA